MQLLATITSKRQLTIPVAMFQNLGLQLTRKVLIRADGNVLTIEPASALVQSLAGSVQIPTKYKGKSTEDIIRDAKHKYFRKRKHDFR